MLDSRNSRHLEVKIFQTFSLAVVPYGTVSYPTPVPDMTA